MKKWLMRKCQLEPHEEQLIEWEAYSSFRKLTPRCRMAWSVKYGAGLLPTGQNLEYDEGIAIIHLAHGATKRSRLQITFFDVHTKK